MCFNTPEWSEAITALGKDDEERGAALGVSYKTAQRYRKQGPPSQIGPLKRQPHLLRLLADIAERCTDCPPTPAS